MTANKCIWCCSTSTGPDCPYLPLYMAPLLVNIREVYNEQ